MFITLPLPTKKKVEVRTASEIYTRLVNPHAGLTSGITKLGLNLEL